MLDGISHQLSIVRRRIMSAYLLPKVSSSGAKTPSLTFRIPAVSTIRYHFRLLHDCHLPDSALRNVDRHIAVQTALSPVVCGGK